MRPRVYFEGRADEPGHHASGDAGVFQAFRGRIYDGEHPRGAGVRGIHFRMHHIEAAVEDRGLSEKDERAAGDEPAVHIFHALEEDHLHLPGIIGHEGPEAMDLVVLEFLRREFRPVAGEKAHLLHCGPHLHAGQVRMDVSDGDDAAAVHIAERIHVQQVSHRTDIQFRQEQLRPFGPHPGEILYGGIHLHLYKGGNNFENGKDPPRFFRSGAVCTTLRYTLVFAWNERQDVAGKWI